MSKSKLNSFQHLKIKPLTANHKNLMSLQVFHVPAPDLVLLSKIRKNSEYPPSASLMASPAELQHALELCNRIPLPYRPHWNAVLPHYTPHAPDIVRLGTWDMDWLCSLMKGWEVEKKTFEASQGWKLSAWEESSSPTSIHSCHSFPLSLTNHNTWSPLVLSYSSEKMTKSPFWRFGYFCQCSFPLPLLLSLTQPLYE